MQKSFPVFCNFATSSTGSVFLKTLPVDVAKFRLRICFPEQTVCSMIGRQWSIRCGECIFYFHFSASGLDRTIVGCQHRVVEGFTSVRQENFSCSPMMEARGFFYWQEGGYLSGPWASEGLLFCDDSPGGFRKGPHQAFHRSIALVLVDKCTCTNARWHKCSVDHDKIF